MKVLVVDDHPMNRLLPRTILAKLGVEVLEAASGAEALECLARSPGVEHVLLDVSMPGMSGTEVCRRLRGEAGTRGLHIVAYTAYDDEEETILAGGFDHLLRKPISRDALLRVLGLES